MASKYHKKIRQVLKQADLSKALTEDLRKELESHFYEKEHELRFSGLKDEELEKQLSEDFGNEELVAKHLNFVHKKSFYSFIKLLMKNENKPPIFNSVFLFILLFFLYQNTLSDMHTSVVIAQLGDYSSGFGYSSDYENHFKFIILGLIFSSSFFLAIRLSRGRALIQKFVSAVMVLVIFIQIGLTYSFVTTNTIFQNRMSYSGTDLIEHPENYYESHSESDEVVYNNLKYGYQIALPRSYGGYTKDGIFRLIKNLNGDEDIASFGPAYASDDELINIEVFDKQSSPDKLADQTWFDYYMIKKLKAKDLQYNYKELPENDFFPINFNTGKTASITLKNEIEGRKNLLLIEEYDRLYVFLYNDKSSVHQSILIKSGALAFFIPKDKIEQLTFNHPTCSFTIDLPSYWITFQKTEEVQEGFFGDIPYKKAVNLEDINNCNFDGFMPADNSSLFINFKKLQGQTLEHYFASKNYSILREGETTWQGLPARRILLSSKIDAVPSTPTIENDSRTTVFAVKTSEDEWLIFSYDSYGGILYKPEDQLEQKIISSIKIKEN